MLVFSKVDRELKIFLGIYYSNLYAYYLKPQLNHLPCHPHCERLISDCYDTLQIYFSKIVNFVTSFTNHTNLTILDTPVV